jgi:phosphomevalonate kinase
MFNTIIIGAGPSGLVCAKKLFTQGQKIAIFDIGSSLKNRNHDAGNDCLVGVGGAGLFSDGKLSDFPAGTQVWKLNRKYLSPVYQELMKCISKYHPIIDSFDASIESQSDWQLKKYPTYYLSLDQRKQLINDFSQDYLGNIVLNTQVIDVVKMASKKYLVVVNDIKRNLIIRYTTYNIVVACGRFTSKLLNKIDFIPKTFMRIEMGVRVEGPADTPIYEQFSKSCIDPKFTSVSGDIEYRTFCWCRNGEVVCCEFDKTKSWSGRSDCEPTGKSNFGFNVRFKNPKYMYLLEQAYNTAPFKIKLDDPSGIDKIDEKYREVYSHIKVGLISFLTNYGVTDFSPFEVIGPTIEGVGYYPLTDDNLRVPNEKIWVSGDGTGKFRGIVASMISGGFVAENIIEVNKPNVILISGKRFNGKGETANILTKYYTSLGKSVHTTAFSYFLKLDFCAMKGLDFDRFMTDHKYKDSYRDEMTSYLDTCDYTSFTKKLIDGIDNHKFGTHTQYDVYLIDDVRCFDAQIKYLNLHCKDRWNICCLRINATEESRQKRGWIKTSYDDHMCENDLDNYTGFDLIINNNGSIKELEDELYRKISVLNEKIEK